MKTFRYEIKHGINSTGKMFFTLLEAKRELKRLRETDLYGTSAWYNICEL